MLSFNPVGKHPFGRRIDNKAQSESDTHPFVDWSNSLYPNYLDYAHGVSSGKPSAMGLQRFKSWLLDELQNVLRLNVRMIKKGNVWQLHGISLRADSNRLPGVYSVPNFEGYPTVNEAAEDPARWEEQLRTWIPERILKDIQILKD